MGRGAEKEGMGRGGERGSSWGRKSSLGDGLEEAELP